MAEELLRHVFVAVSVTDVVRRTGGQLSAVFEVRCTPPTAPVVIKIYPDRWRWKQEKEIHVYRLLEHGASVRCRALCTASATVTPGGRPAPS